jgi:hypothetical protein
MTVKKVLKSPFLGQKSTKKTLESVTFLVLIYVIIPRDSRFVID